MKIRALTASVLAVVVAATALQAVVPPERSDAAVASQFNPGLIISDALFFDGGAMSASTVQNFLNSQVTTCVAGYTCLKDYHQDTQTRAATPGRCDAYIGAANESAATIIARVGAACGISQKVLLVLTQKEVGLVTSVAPSSLLYRKAMGYGCPDTAPCDSLYYGFFNQVYSAASQFKAYAANPTHWNNIAGRSNTVLYSPKAGCGSSSVFIQNQATAGLYNYTPYQPDASALANLYGSGDACASYGNRNFWVYYTDWFGSTVASSLMRTTDNPTVYLINGSNKYPIASYELYTSLAPLGGATFVSQSYLDQFATGHVMGRVIRGDDGAIYFVDSGIKLLFTSCAMVVDYGGSCDPSGYTPLSNAQIAALYTGPAVVSVLATQEGSRFYLSAGVKHEILDGQAQAAAGIPAGFNVLTEAALENLPYGSPIVRDSTWVRNRETGAYVFLNSSKQYPIYSGDVPALGVVPHLAGALHAASLAYLPQSPVIFNGAVQVAGTGPVQIVQQSGRVTISTPAIAASLAPLPVPQSFVDTYPGGSVLSTGSAIKSGISDSVYFISDSSIRAIVTWRTLVAVSGASSPNITTLPWSAIAFMPKGPDQLEPGAMYRTADDSAIYLIDGTGTRVPISRFDIPAAAGFIRWDYASDSDLAAYAAASSSLAFGVTCSGINYIAAGGQLHAVAPTLANLFPPTYTPLSASTCSLIPIGKPAVGFIRTADGSIYQLVAGAMKRWVSAARFSTVNAGAGWLDVSDSFAGQFSDGPQA